MVATYKDLGDKDAVHYLTKDGIETIEQALADAYLINPVLNAEKARLPATDEQVALAKSGLRPFISASGDTAFMLKSLILFGLLCAQLRAEPGCKVSIPEDDHGQQP